MNIGRFGSRQIPLFRFWIAPPYFNFPTPSWLSCCFPTPPPPRSAAGAALPGRCLLLTQLPDAASSPGHQHPKGCRRLLTWPPAPPLCPAWGLGTPTPQGPRHHLNRWPPHLCPPPLRPEATTDLATAANSDEVVWIALIWMNCFDWNVRSIWMLLNY
jgi:hypothetical protein